MSVPSSFLQVLHCHQIHKAPTIHCWLRLTSSEPAILAATPCQALGPTQQMVFDKQIFMAPICLVSHHCFHQVVELFLWWGQPSSASQLGHLMSTERVLCVEFTPCVTQECNKTQPNLLDDSCTFTILPFFLTNNLHFSSFHCVGTCCPGEFSLRQIRSGLQPADSASAPAADFGGVVLISAPSSLP